MDSELVKKLKRPTPPKEIKDLQELVMGLVKKSRGKAAKKFSQWDRNNDVYNNIRKPDEKDVVSKENGEPVKMVVPMSYAQIQTFAAFCFLLFTQGKTFYSLNPTGDEDFNIRDAGENTLERDLRWNKFASILYQILIDLGRFGIAVTKTQWVEQKVFVPDVSASTGSVDLTAEGDVVTKEVVKYEGNRITNVSPYRWFPDYRQSITTWDQGQYCGDESEMDYQTLSIMEKKGEIGGLANVQPMTKTLMEKRKGSAFEGLAGSLKESKDGKTKEHVIITEVQIKLIPKDHDLGKEDHEVLFVVWLANDSRIIRIDRMGYVHMEFTYDMSLFSPDMHQKVTESLSDAIYDLQDIISWLMNSRIGSVQRGLDGKLVADPDYFDRASFEDNESPVVFLKRGAPKVGVNQFFGQLQYRDTTVGHMQDAQQLIGMINVVTGINENAMGQFTSGRRSATEARAVNAGAAGRLKLVASLINAMHLSPMGKKMLITQRQTMSFETFSKIRGKSQSVVEEYAIFHPMDVTELVGNEDFFVFDTTLESEKGFIAQSLQELLTAMMGNPETAQIFNIDPKALLDEIMELRGVGKLGRFSYEQSGNMSPMQQQGIQNGNTGIVQPGVDPNLQGVTGV